MPAYVIAEAGVNHNGDLTLAQRLVDAAADAKADAVKFQTFRADKIVSRHVPKAAYQARETGSAESQLEMIRRLELTESAHEALIARAKSRGIAFLSTPFDLESLRLLTGRFGLRTIKIASGEITNAPLLLATARAADQVILSTGMSTVDDVRAALGALAFGFTKAKGDPRAGSFAAAFKSPAGTRALRKRVTLLHCTTEYPAPLGEVNLRAMDTMAKTFGLRVGYSDHTQGIHVSIAAAAMGAVMIEKHFTLDRSLPGPDHKASLEPAELAEMVRQIRDVERALGDGKKKPTPSELKNRAVARKSLVAARPIEKGEPFDADNVALKRAGDGVSPFAYWKTLGRRATRRYETDEALDG